MRPALVDLLEHLKLLEDQVERGDARAGDVATWASQAIYQPLLDHVWHGQRPRRESGGVKYIRFGFG